MSSTVETILLEKVHALELEVQNLKNKRERDLDTVWGAAANLQRHDANAAVFYFDYVRE